MTPEERKALEEDQQKLWSAIGEIKNDVGSLAEAKEGGYDAEQLKKLSDKMNEIEVKLRTPRQPTPAAGAGMEVKEVSAWAEYLGVAEDAVTLEQVKAAREEFGAYLRKGDERLEVKTLRTDSNVDGGYLVVPEYDTQIIKDLAEVSPMRRVARVRTTRTGVFKAPVRDSVPSAQWLGETEQDELTEAGYGLEEIPNGTMRSTTRATREMLEDSGFDIEAEIRSDAVEQYAKAEGTAFVRGNGVRKPKGFLEDSRISTVVTGDASDITYAGLIRLTHDGNINYLPGSRLIMNLSTLGDARLLEDGADQLIFRPGINDIASTLAGFQFEIFQDMPDVGAGNKPIAFGDWRRGYLVIDRVQFSLLRDPYSAKRTGSVEFTGYKRVGGQVVLPSALRIQVVST